jgi:LysR family transcriptional regulator, low CO2-responsive transcriptional regulator
MRYVQLRAFHYVATEGGFSRAAEALRLTQPAISDQVRRLELEYDVLLFHRHKRRVDITEDGRRLLEITNRLFEVEAQAHDFLSESRALRSGRLRIIADSAIHLTEILTAFRTKYPTVQISLRSGNSEQVIRALYEYNAELGVLGIMPEARELTVIGFGATPIVAFTGLGTPWADMMALDLAQASNFPLVLREPGSKTRQKVEEAARALGVDLNPAIEAEGREAVREIVAAGGGIGFVSQAEFRPDPRIRSFPHRRSVHPDGRSACLSVGARRGTADQGLRIAGNRPTPQTLSRTSPMIRAVSAQVGSTRAAASPPADSASRSAVSVSTRRSASASAAGSSGGTSRPAPSGTVSGTAPARVVTMGRPWHSASLNTMP